MKLSTTINKPEFLSDMYFRSPAGLLSFAIDPTTPLDPEYIECQLEGVEFFDQYFREELDESLYFNDFLKEHHKIIAVGKGGDRCYFIRREDNIYSRDFPSEFRQSGHGVSMSVPDAETTDYPPGTFITDSDGEDVKKVWLSGIPKQATPEIARGENEYWFIFPDSKYRPIYFDAMNRDLIALRDFSKVYSSTQTLDRDLFIETLAHYYHLGVVIHPFKRINQSMFMVHVNYLLLLNGFDPVYHSNLDKIGIFLDSNTFTPYFYSHLIQCSVNKWTNPLL